MNIYVGNLPFSTTEDELREQASEHGEITSCTIIRDRDTGRSRGFGFLEMPNDDEAQALIAGLNGKDMGGRALTVNEARPREDRGGGGGYREGCAQGHLHIQTSSSICNFKAMSWSSLNAKAKDGGELGNSHRCW